MGGTTSPDIAAREKGAVTGAGSRAAGLLCARCSAALEGLPASPFTSLGLGYGVGGPTAWGRGVRLGTKPRGPAQTPCGRGRAPGLSGWDARLPTRPGGWFIADGGPGSPEAASAHGCEPTCSLSLSESWTACVPSALALASARLLIALDRNGESHVLQHQSHSALPSLGQGPRRDPGRSSASAGSSE